MPVPFLAGESCGGSIGREGFLREHDLSTGGGVLDRVTDVARCALACYDVAPDSEVHLLAVSENATFRVDDGAAGRSLVLRVSRLGYHTRDEIASELAWLDALRQHAGIRTAGVVRGRAGEQLVTVSDATGHARACVMFEFLPGAPPEDDRLVESFEHLGEITALLHRHAREWTPPPGFTRFPWDYDAAFGAEARWGRWQDGLGVGRAEREVLGRLDRALRRRLRAYGNDRSRFGLVHADLRLANLLVSDGQVAVIDFDDCGHSWFLYDLGAALSFIEHRPQVPVLIDAWLKGYRRVAALPAADEAEIPTFVLFRRLLLIAWIGSHRGVEFARSLGAAYTADSCALAEDYLSRFA